jgi:hypothetical protein
MMTVSDIGWDQLNSKQFGKTRRNVRLYRMDQ